jgi:hypothetical protein
MSNGVFVTKLSSYCGGLEFAKLGGQNEMGDGGFNFFSNLDPADRAANWRPGFELNFSHVITLLGLRMYLFVNVPRKNI